MATEERPATERLPWVDALVLGFMLFAVSFVTGPDTYLSTDIGGKTAAVQAMVDRGDWSTDIGYWAENVDPDGSAHPFYGTTLMANGWWVNTTSIPMVVGARPLWEIGGARAALVLPIAGAVAAALAAAALFRQFYRGAGRIALWAVGLTTPVTIYALQFWEHTLGLALMAWAVVWTVDAMRSGRVVPPAFAGLAFGMAATMRQEALVYGAVAGLVLVYEVLSTWRASDRRSLELVRSLMAPAAMAGGALATIVGYAAIERAYYGAGFRGSRNLGTASQAGDGAVERLEAAWATTITPLNTSHPLTYAVGLLLVVPLVWLGIEIVRGRPLRMPAFTLSATVALLALRVFATGPTFVPGLVATAPIAAVGLVLALSSRRWQILAFALAPLPLIWLVQFPSGALPQWGGRYQLLTGLILVVVSVGELSRRHRPAMFALLALGAAVTASGLWWTASRDDQLVADFSAIETVSDGDIVVWYDPFKAREAGPIVLDQRWLSTHGRDGASDVASILAAVDAERFVWLDRAREDPVTFVGFAPQPTAETVELSSVLDVEITIYVRVDE